MQRARWIVTIVLLAAACSSARHEPIAPAAADSGAFTITGDPAAAAGATWTYRGTTEGVTYDLQGHLFKPAGAGPFPAVIISHGNGGSNRPSWMEPRRSPRSHVP